MTKAKKEKAPSNVDPGESVILNYLKTQNRPYSLIDIFNNLHGTVGKTALTKILITLQDHGEISTKTYGKQLVYVARQDLLPIPSTEELRILDYEIDELKICLQKEKESHKNIQSKLLLITSSMTTVELKHKILSLESTVLELKERLDPLERGTVKVDPQERMNVEHQHEVHIKAWKQRKKLCNEIIGMLTESISKKPNEMIEDLGLEIDPI